MFFYRAGAEGAYPEPQHSGERLHRGRAGPPGAHLPFPSEGLLSRVGHRHGTCGEDPKAAQHHVEKGTGKKNTVW